VEISLTSIHALLQASALCFALEKRDSSFARKPLPQ
jgi:hypothetical protein